MTALTIGNVDTEPKHRLCMRAARNGRSMEAGLRLREALGGVREDREPNLAEAIRRRFSPLCGIDEIEAHAPVSLGGFPALDR